jgi:hypothetical protein
MITRRNVVLVAATALLIGLIGLGSTLVVGRLAAAGSRRGRSASSYCDAARAVDDYHGRRAATLGALLDRVVELAPADIAPEARTMRASRANRARYATAEQAWSRYNTNHCCACIGGPSAPVVLTTTPP